MILEEFVPLVGTALLVDCQPDAARLTLVSAKPLPATAQADRPPFSLMFRSEPDVLLVDGSYVMRGDAFGPDRIFISSLVAPSQSPPGYYYQAVFN